MDEKDDQIAHHRMLAGREIPMNYGPNNNSPATGTGIVRDGRLWRFRTRRDCRIEPTGISEQKSGIAKFTLDIDR